MSVTPATFRADFPEFTSTTTYTDAQVNLYIGLAGKLLNADRWGDVLDYGTELFAAHHLALQAREAAAALAGGGVGVVTGPQASKAVGNVSAAYNSQAATFADAPFWNATAYGIRLYQLARLMGAGGVQL